MEKAFLSFVIAGIALLCLFPLLFAAAAQQKKMLAWAIPRAVEIARFQGWVSPHRLMTQAHMTKNIRNTHWLRHVNRVCYFKQ
jgi:hypothetical protein